jgi:arylsulfatase A-like enzyme
MQCVREGNLKYIHYGDGAEELFDLACDPGELHNLSADASHLIDLVRLRGHWQRSRPRVPSHALTVSNAKAAGFAKAAGSD